MLAHSAHHATALARLETLLSRVPLGLRLTQPWQVVLAGRPNAGKSSLLNALLGFQRSITSAEPGTTRDVVTARTAFDGWPVELCDTAGLRTSSNAIEIAGVERAEQELRAADLVLGLIPANETADDAAVQLQDLRQLRANGPLLIIRTKADMISSPRADGGLAVSAVSREGLAELATAIVEQLVGSAPPPGAAVPFLDEQRIVLEQAQAALRAGDSTAAASLLQAFSNSATSEP